AGWRVRDLGSTNGTYLIGNRLGPGEWPVRPHDIVRFGNVTIVVDSMKEIDEEENEKDCPIENMAIAAAESQSWEDAVMGVAFDRNESPRPGDQLLVLLRAGHHLVHLESEDELLH